MKRTVTNKYLREELLLDFQGFSLESAAQYLGVSQKRVKEILKKDRDSAVLNYVALTQKKNKIKSTLCWYCDHCTNREGVCSWSRDLQPRDDWEANDYEEYQQNCCCETCIIVKNCKGFTAESHLSCSRKIVEIILKDFFKKHPCLGGRFFSRIDLKTFRRWLNVYNNICKLAGVRPIKLKEISGNDL